MESRFCWKEIKSRSSQDKDKDPRTFEGDSQGKDPRTLKVISQEEDANTSPICAQHTERWCERKSREAHFAG